MQTLISSILCDKQHLNPVKETPTLVYLELDGPSMLMTGSLLSVNQPHGTKDCRNPSLIVFISKCSYLLNTSLCGDNCITLVIFDTFLLHFTNSILFLLRCESGLQAVFKTGTCVMD